MQVSPSFDSGWKTMRRCLNGPVGVAFAAALLVVITYQLVSSTVWETRREGWPLFQPAA